MSHPHHDDDHDGFEAVWEAVTRDCPHEKVCPCCGYRKFCETCDPPLYDCGCALDQICRKCFSCACYGCMCDKPCSCGSLICTSVGDADIPQLPNGLVRVDAEYWRRKRAARADVDELRRMMQIASPIEGGKQEL
jgi:hypothetical protein